MNDIIVCKETKGGDGMKIDITYPLTYEAMAAWWKRFGGEIARFGHWGTHLDMMEGTFPLDYCERNGRIFDVRGIMDREIDVHDIDFRQIQANDCVLFYTSMIENVPYGCDAYLYERPQFARALIERLADCRVSLIGIDMAGLRRGREHAWADQFLAHRGIYVVENLMNLNIVWQYAQERSFSVSTYPLNCVECTGLPCRVVVDMAD